jgi:hypothetical protein
MGWEVLPRYHAAVRVDPIHGFGPTRLGKKKPQSIPGSRRPPDHGMDFRKMVRPREVPRCYVAET